MYALGILELFQLCILNNYNVIYIIFSNILHNISYIYNLFNLTKKINDNSDITGDQFSIFLEHFSF